MSRLVRSLPTLAAVLSAMVIAGGFALIYLPAGLIVGGALGLIAAIAFERGSERRPPPPTDAA